MTPIATHRQVLETPAQTGAGEAARGHVRSARLRLMVAIPAAMAIGALAAGVLGYQALLSIEERTEPAALSYALVFLVTGLLVIAMLAAILGVAVARSILGPLTRLGGQIAALEQGEAVEPLEVADGTEIGVLSQRFNAMLQALRERTVRQSQGIMEQFAGALITVSAEGHVVAVNSAARQMLGMVAEDATGRPLSDLLMASGTNGDLVRVIEQLLETGEDIGPVELASEGPAGSTRRVSVKGTVNRDLRGRVSGAVVNLRDLEAIDAFREQLRNADQLAAVSTFASGVAHEFRNPLASIKAMAQLLGEDASTDERLARYTAVIESEIDRLDETVRQLQAFTQAPRRNRDRCSLREVLQEALGFARHRFAEEESEADPPPVSFLCDDLGEIRGDPDRLVQALFHILLNALEWASERGEVWVRGTLEASPPSAVIEIGNSGSSVPPDIRDRVFAPFFTTRANRPGLGLSVARQIISQHQGDIEIRSGEDHVTLRVTLPIAPARDGETGAP